MSSELPGLSDVRNRFLNILQDRQNRIATHAITAWDGDELEVVNGNLAAAQAILHQISGTAGSLGFTELGQQARHCENEIIHHLKSEDADLPLCPGELIYHLDVFVTACQELLSAELRR